MTTNNSSPTSKENSQNDIVKIIEDFSFVAKQRGVEFEGYNRVSLQTYNRLPLPIQNSIKESIQTATKLAADVISILPFVAEIEMLRDACDNVNLEIPEDFLKKIRPEDIVEVYEAETMIQIYRNLEFLKHCSYDLLTVCSTPFPELFKREEGFDQKILDRAKQVCKNSNKTEKWNIPDHTLIEIMEPHNKITLMKLGYVAPVKHKVTGKKMAWASTLRVEHLGSYCENYKNVIPISHMSL